MDRLTFTPEELTWTTLYGPNERPMGRAAVPAKLIVGRLDFVDGWSVSWATPIVEFQGLTAVVPDDNGYPQPAPFPALVVSFPDYPRDGSATYLIGIEDAKKIARDMLDSCREAEQQTGHIWKALTRLAKKKEVDEARVQQQKTAWETTRCSIDKCHKTRSMFDEHGNGYCKRHAQELGIRPHGKIA